MGKARNSGAKLSVQLYDIDAIFGKNGMARHEVVLSLACEYPHPSLITQQNEAQLLLQQIQA